MNWEAIGAIGEIIGAGAVVISLVYLGRQIQIQNRESQIAAMHEISVGFRDATAVLLNAGITEIFVRGIHDFDSLSEEDRLKLVIGLVSVYRAWEEAYIQRDLGRLDDRAWQPMLSYYTLILSSPSGRKVWDLRKDHFDPAFRAFVDDLAHANYSLD